MPSYRRSTGRIQLPKPPRKVAFPTGPKLLKLDKKPVVVGGPGEPPAGFLNGNNSRSEWFIYWALLRVKGPPGYRFWSYQKAEAGGRNLPGGGVIDFVIEDQEPRLAWRVQTERYHVAVTTARHAYDWEQRLMLERLGWRVIDLWEKDFIHDPSGRAAIHVVLKALQGVQLPNPITAGVGNVRAA